MDPYDDSRFKRKREPELIQPLRKRPKRILKSKLPFQIRNVFSSNGPHELKLCGRTLSKIHNEPVLFRITNFLTDKECDHLLNLAQKKTFTKSFTEGDSNILVFSEQRTSDFIFFKHSQDAIIRRIQTRCADILGLTSNHVEPLQVVHYTNGAEFKLHHDAGTLDENDHSIEIVEPKRIVTFFVYLNTLPEGVGHTDFPIANLSMRPVKGTAVLWLNVKVDDPAVADYRTSHRANPVGEGLEKFGLNIWVTQKSMSYS